MLHGINFGATDSSSTAAFGNTACASAAWLSDSSVRCTGGGLNGPPWLSLAHSRQLSIMLTVGATEGTMLNTFTFDAPVITSSEPANICMSGGASFTLLGTNLGARMHICVHACVCGARGA